VGNRLTQQTLTQTTVYTYDTANRLINVNGVAYTWDANGNLLNDGVYTYTYDAADRLITTTQGANTYTFKYNGLGDRVKQTANGIVTTYTLDLNAGLTQVLADGTNTYLYGLTRIGEQQPGGFAYHLPDALGSVRQLANASGSVTLARSYEPYGNTLTSVGSGITVYHFTGKIRDANTNLLYLRARYYALGVGRFVTRDSWKGDPFHPNSLHKYVYALNNPVLYVDPSGHQACEWLDFQCETLESLRKQAEACYQSNNMPCLWAVYYTLSVGGGLLQYPHAAFHMRNFLLKGGDITYSELGPRQLLSSYWVANADSVKSQYVPDLELNALAKVHGSVRKGQFEGVIRTDPIVAAADSSTEIDLYYAMFQFTLEAHGGYKVMQLSDCSYQVRLQLTYEFFDHYDWHPGLIAGGAVVGLSGFKDDWTKALATSGWAAEYDIRGSWQEPPKVYLFDSAWLSNDTPTPPIEVTQPRN